MSDALAVEIRPEIAERAFALRGLGCRVPVEKAPDHPSSAHRMGRRMRWCIVLLMAVALLLPQSCSDDKSTEPSVKVPVLTTAAISGITSTSAECGGSITSDGGAAVSARGVCWSTHQTPTTADNKTTDGGGAGSFASSVTGLTSGTTFYVRAYATNSAGTGYGEEVSFGTNGTVTDVDGNVYPTIKVGSQWWMAENLKVTHYRNGAEIPVVTDGDTWAGLTTGACCSPANQDSSVATYGRLYNWHAVHESGNLAPAGWHVPTDAEWLTLIDYLGGEWVAGGKMKEAGTEHWASPNLDATDESRFSALPAGYRASQGFFGSGHDHTMFWSATACDADNAWARALAYDYAAAIQEYDPKGSGFSIRCVR